MKQLEDRTKVASAEFDAAKERQSRAIAAAKARSELAQEIVGLLREVERLKAAYEGDLPELERARERSRKADEESAKADQTTEEAEQLANQTKNDHELLRLQFDAQLLSERGKRAERALKDSREAGEALAGGGVSD